MISCSHWGMFDPDVMIPFGAAPIQIIAGIYQIARSLEHSAVNLTGCYLRLIA